MKHYRFTMSIKTEDHVMCKCFDRGLGRDRLKGYAGRRYRPQGGRFKRMFLDEASLIHIGSDQTEALRAILKIDEHVVSCSRPATLLFAMH
jgi:hypothetical protein